jgi:hypothetical protein
MVKDCQSDGIKAKNTRLRKSTTFADAVIPRPCHFAIPHMPKSSLTGLKQRAGNLLTAWPNRRQSALTDVVVFCALARFCDRAGGVWDNTRASDDPEARKIAIQEVGDCPAGRLVLRDKAGNLIEPEFEPSIGLVLDPVVAELGPIWVRGGVPIESSDGTTYAAAAIPPINLFATAGIQTENSVLKGRVS